ncbi:MAG: histidine kinase [Candidatus Eisenbacteria bacterium]
MTVSFWKFTAPYAITTVIGAITGGVATHLLRAVMWRRRWFELGLGKLLPRLIAAVVVTTLVIEGTILLLGIYVTHAYTWKTSTPGILFVTTFNWMFTILLWTAIYTGVRFFRRWRDSEIQRLKLEVLARDAQLDALNAQIQPHFLFNALNVLRAMIAENPELARDLVTELSDLMRYALQAARRDRVPLVEELAVVESYLKIESARFEDRLRWRIDAAGDVRDARMPPMLLQTLVENAVKHGIAAEENGGDVLVHAGREGNTVRLRVTNPGRLGGRGDTRIGIANSRERLRLLYGERASLTLTEKGGLVVAEVVLPVDERAERLAAPVTGAAAGS